MGLPIPEPDELVLDGGAVAGAGRLQPAAVHRGEMQVVEDQAAGPGRGRGRMAGQLARDPVQDRGLLLRRLPAAGGSLPVAEPGRRLVSGLLLEAGEVDGPAEQPRRRAGLEPAQLQAQLPERAGEARRRRLPRASPAAPVLAHMHQPHEEGPGGQHHGLRQVPDSQAGLHSTGLTVPGSPRARPAPGSGSGSAAARRST